MPTALDSDVRPGDPSLPACVFVHGLGTSKENWTDLAEARMLGGYFRIGSLLGRSAERPTLYHRLHEAGFSVACWTQSRPLGPMDLAVEELFEMIERVDKEVPHSGLVLIGHSRGGLVIRRACMLRAPIGLRGIVTLCSPHGGSNLARWADQMRRMAGFLENHMDQKEGSTPGLITRRLTEFIKSPAVAELLPGSEFLRSLPPADSGIYTLSLGGTDPVLFNTNSLASALPSALSRLQNLPPELTHGTGDALVSAHNARLPAGSEHLDFHVNHITVVNDPVAIGAVVERVREHCVKGKG